MAIKKRAAGSSSQSPLQKKRMFPNDMDDSSARLGRTSTWRWIVSRRNELMRSTLSHSRQLLIDDPHGLFGHPYHPRPPPSSIRLDPGQPSSGHYLAFAAHPCGPARSRTAGERMGHVPSVHADRDRHHGRPQGLQESGQVGRRLCWTYGRFDDHARGASWTYCCIGIVGLCSECC